LYTKSDFFKFFRFLLIFFLLSVPGIVSAQTFSLTAQPGIVIPTGPEYTAAGKAAYKSGFRMSLQGSFAPGESGFRIASVFDYSLLPLSGQSDTALNLFALGAGPGFVFKTKGRFSFRTMITGGYFFGFIKDSSGGNFFTQAKAGAGFALSPSVDLNLDADYSYYFGGGSIFSNTFNGIGISFGISYKPGAGGRSGIDIKENNLQPIFPVLHAAYDTVPLGSVTVRNKESGPVENVVISYYLPDYMDSPGIVETLDKINRNEEKNILLHAILNKKILNETEGTFVNAEITVTYNYRGIEKKYTKQLRTEILYRNALIWDDDRKAASFVTAKDPAVLTFSRNSMNVVSSCANHGSDPALRQAMAVYEALKLYGLSYVVDPDSSYQELSQGTSLDFIQFPLETLTYKAGDCDDLSILFVSLMESLSVETAFITVPGHIYTAFALETEPGDADKIFPRSKDNLIVYNNRLWVPVEITMVESEDFVKAWRFGAFEWRKYNDRSKAEFLPVREAWKIYKPVGLLSASASLEYPQESKVSKVYCSVLADYISEEIKFRAEELKDKINSSSGRAKQKAINALGVLYARNGLFDDAIGVLAPLASGSNVYSPSVLNLANLYYLTGKTELAVSYYKKASETMKNPAAAFLGLAMAEYRLGNSDAAEKAYSEFSVLAPDKAEKYAYLNGSGSELTRASSGLNNSDVLWVDEK